MARGRSMASKAMRYVLTGGSAAVVDAGGFVALLAAGLPAAPAATASFCIAAGVNYLLTSRFVFGAGLSRVRFAKFLFFSIVGLGINVGITLVLIHAAALPPSMAKIGGIGFAFFANFAINAGLVFPDRARDRTQAPLAARAGDTLNRMRALPPRPHGSCHSPGRGDHDGAPGKAPLT
jgi:putative flippase GtrA